MRILIADDHPVVRQGVRLILESEPGMLVAGEAKTGLEAIKLVREYTWAVVILDINLPDLNGLDVLHEIKRLHPELPVLIMSILPESSVAVRALKAGADGYLNKGSAPEEMVRAVRKVASGGKYISPSLAERLATEVGGRSGEVPHERLSEREYQVMCQLAAGKTVTQIGEALNRSVNTISTYRSRILTKMGLSSNADLTHYAIHNHLI